MSHVWSVEAGNVIRLTLDGADTGPISRSRTFTGADGIQVNDLHTVYLTVTPDVTAVNAFLEVEGGDTVVAEVTGPQVLEARGESDGSANLTVRFGVQNAEGAPSTSGSDDLDHVNQAAAEAAGWTFDPDGGSFTFDTGRAIDVFTTSLRITAGGSGSEPVMARTFTVVSGEVYTVRAWVASGPAMPWYVEGTMRAVSGANSGSQSINGGEPDQQLSFPIQASGTSLTVSFTTRELFGSGDFFAAGLTIQGGSSAGAEVDFEDLGFCVGTGVGDGGTGAGGDEDTPGTDPIPDPPPGGWPPPPAGGPRAFGNFNIPAAGLGVWNSTIKEMSPPVGLENLLNQATAADAFLWLTGHWRDWLDASGRFQYALWKADMDAIKANTRASDALDAGIASGVAKAHYLIDEPFHPFRYGGPIAFATVERMCLYSKELWPTWPVLVRVPPTKSQMTRHMNGCDWLWSEYDLSRGNVDTWLAREFARATELDHGLVLGLHYLDFDGNYTGRPFSQRRHITPSELRHYGGILASNSTSIALMGWRYTDILVAQAGFWAAATYVRDLDVSSHP